MTLYPCRQSVQVWTTPADSEYAVFREVSNQTD